MSKVVLGALGQDATTQENRNGYHHPKMGPVLAHWHGAGNGVADHPPKALSSQTACQNDLGGPFVTTQSRKMRLENQVSFHALATK